MLAVSTGLEATWHKIRHVRRPQVQWLCRWVPTVLLHRQSRAYRGPKARSAGTDRAHQLWQAVAGWRALTTLLTWHFAYISSFFTTCITNWSRGAMDSASVSGTEGCRFESYRDRSCFMALGGLVLPQYGLPGLLWPQVPLGAAPPARTPSSGTGVQAPPTIQVAKTPSSGRGGPGTPRTPPFEGGVRAPPASQPPLSKGGVLAAHPKTPSFGTVGPVPQPPLIPQVLKGGVLAWCQDGSARSCLLCACSRLGPACYCEPAAPWGLQHSPAPTHPSRDPQFSRGGSSAAAHHPKTPSSKTGGPVRPTTRDPQF